MKSGLTSPLYHVWFLKNFEITKIKRYSWKSGSEEEEAVTVLQHLLRLPYLLPVPLEANYWFQFLQTDFLSYWVQTYVQLPGFHPVGVAGKLPQQVCCEGQVQEDEKQELPFMWKP